MPANFAGHWHSTSSSGWEAFLKQFGIPVEKFPADIKVTEEITQSGDNVTVKTTNNKDDKVKVASIQVGGHHKEAMVAGGEVDFTTAWDGGRLVMTRADGKGSVVRELDGANMKLSLTHQGVTATTTYARA